MEAANLSAAIDNLVALGTKNRAVQIELKDGSGRIAVYDDAQAGYVPFDRVVIQSGSVSNIESFAALVVEEMRRRESEDGSFATVTFSLTGATFSPDDRVRLDSFGYTRALSPQWQLLVKSLGVEMDHAHFVRLLQSLRPSIVDYESVIRQFRKVYFGNNVAISSAPTMEEGRSGNSWAVAFEAKSQAGQTALPTQFDVSIPFARASSARYGLPVGVDLRYDEKARSVAFSLTAPDLVWIEEQAIADEIASFRGNVYMLEKLLILVDF